MFVICIVIVYCSLCPSPYTCMDWDTGYACILQLMHILSRGIVDQPRSQGFCRETVTRDPGKIRFIVPKFWEKNCMRSEPQPYSTVLQYGCVALRMWFFPQNFRTIKWILPGSSSPSHREGPETEVDCWLVYILDGKASFKMIVLRLNRKKTR